jgi:hypothetical protein
LQISDTQNAWGHIHDDAASACLLSSLDQLKRLSELLIDLGSGQKPQWSKVDILNHIDEFKGRLLQQRMESVDNMSIFSIAVLFNMRAGRHFVECMFLRHHLGAVGAFVTERRLHDFTCMLKWITKIQQHSPEFSQHENNTRLISLQLAKLGRDIVFEVSTDNSKKILLLMSATLEIAIALRHQLHGQVQVILQDDHLRESEEHVEFCRRVIEARASQIESEVRQLLSIVGVQTLDVLLEGAVYQHLQHKSDM